MMEMVIDSIRVSLMNYQRVVILKEKDSDRYLPIWIGPAEADAIAVKLQDVSVPRPLTHDLLHSVLESLGAAVTHIVVTDLNNDTFYAKIIIKNNGSDSDIEVDSRPSDAIALAVRTQVPIFADEGVLEKAGVLLDKETGRPVDEEGNEREEKPMDAGEIERLSAFKDFIQTLDMEDFEASGEGKSK